jgi:hypothetical protein
MRFYLRTVGCGRFERTLETGRLSMKKRTGSILDLEGCIPKLDHVVTIEEMDKGIADAIREDWLRFERQSRGDEKQEEIVPQSMRG